MTTAGTGQPDLFRAPQVTQAAEIRRIPYRGLAPHNQEETSRAAAESIDPHKGTLQWEVLRYIRKMGRYGATADEGAHALDLDSNTYTPRRRELAIMGFIIKSGEKRKTRSGRQAFVWVAHEYGPRGGSNEG